MALAVSDLDAFYGQAQILHGVAIRAPDRGRVSVLGRNGAGKTTLLKCIMNAGPRATGRIEWNGASLGAISFHRRARLGFALVPEDRRIFHHLTVADNIAMAKYALPKGESLDPRAALERFPALVPLAERYGFQLSGGQQQLVAVARGVAARPRLLLLDEPTEGLAPLIIEQMAKDLSAALAESSAALILCEQNIAFARKCADYVYVIDSGRIVFEGDWRAFDGADDVIGRYLAV